MRWTISKFGLREKVDGPSTHGKNVEVISASYTDEDVERVAEALADLDDDDCFSSDVELPGYAEARALSRSTYRKYARAALDAYLNQPTEEDT